MAQILPDTVRCGVRCKDRVRLAKIGFQASESTRDSQGEIAKVVLTFDRQEALPGPRRSPNLPTGHGLFLRKYEHITFMLNPGVSLHLYTDMCFKYGCSVPELDNSMRIVLGGRVQPVRAENFVHVMRPGSIRE
jgi:hypothetical protein